MRKYSGCSRWPRLGSGMARSCVSRLFSAVSQSILHRLLPCKLPCHLGWPAERSVAGVEHHSGRFRMEEQNMLLGDLVRGRTKGGEPVFEQRCVPHQKSSQLRLPKAGCTRSKLGEFDIWFVCLLSRMYRIGVEYNVRQLLASPFLRSEVPSE